ncbi:hypothetical protein QBC37DRAFT_462345 [Rhypophila decipiens]|uniref:DUF7907 domain-containing protein n=1 Tax=Rhypophila decipiens TaxID=261697 RepID=A0AAN6Y952_9PEZI|nr:hypothetical protein QBC37DRAFT_462345 [Rhypophila decipiens]
MHSTLLPTLGLSLLALSTVSTSCVPVPSASRGFRLAVNVTDPTKDTNQPPLQGQYLHLLHIGAGSERACVGPSPGPIFYQNGTCDDFATETIDIITDIHSRPWTPERLSLAGWDDELGLGIYGFFWAGSGGIRLTRLWDPCSYSTVQEGAPTESTLVVCRNRTIPYYGPDIMWDIVNWVQASSGTHLVIPEGCVAVRFVPECAVLNDDLPPDAYSSHEFAQEVRCYEDVKSVVW